MHSVKLRDTLKLLLASELGEYEIGGTRSPSIRIVPPQVADYITMHVAEGRGIECLIYQDPRVEPSSMQADLEFYEVVLRQHNLEQPTTSARKLITSVFPSVQPIRSQQAQIKGETKLEQVFLEIPRYYAFDGKTITRRIERLIDGN